MTNEEIIYRASISAGIFTEAEAQKFAQNGWELPLHTFAVWKNHGYSVKKGEHAALKVRLWRKKGVKSDKASDDKEAKEAEVEGGGYYLVTAFLFTGGQVEQIGKPA